MTGILIAEPETRIASFLVKGLRASGFSTGLATEGEEVVRLADSDRYSLLVLDLDLPDALRVVHRMRPRREPLPVVVLTGHYRSSDRRLAAYRGDVDYVTKPFRFDELLARIEARLNAGRTPETPVVRVADVALDLRTRTALVGERAVQLSPREFELALAFLRRAGEVITREELLGAVWGFDFDPRSNIVDVYVGYLRRKLGRDRITSIRRVGYRFETGPRPDSDGGRGRRATTPPWALALLGGAATALVRSAATV